MPALPSDVLAAPVGEILAAADDDLSTLSRARRWLGWMRTGLPHPGKFEEINREAKEVLGNVEFFDGLKLESSRGLSENFAVTQIVTLAGAENQQNYLFNATVQNNKFMCLGRYDTEGRVMGRLGYSPTPSLSLSAVLQQQRTPPEEQIPGGADFLGNATFEADYTGADNSAQFKADPTGLMAFSYMQSILPRVSAGTEVIHIPGQINLMSAGIRYSSARSIFSLTGNNMLNATASYTFKPEKTKAEFCTELSVLPGQERWESLWSGGFRYEMKTSRFKAFVNSQGNVGSLLEEQINNFLRVTMCADMDYKKKVYKFGFGLTIAM
eukprot:TRINITY_DN2862_c0_g1_i1.p1 TRINITY_DN2862_c0_g1~~TRINITY_DN2862_c0_g1_i1.p1  ORF type:complete len:368 (-),score=76.19 TRINITY_DN2862_c0_g1_i1:137-1111(-)